jgi:hypothetical protein
LEATDAYVVGLTVAVTVQRLTRHAGPITKVLIQFVELASMPLKTASQNILKSKKIERRRASSKWFRNPMFSISKISTHVQRYHYLFRPYPLQMEVQIQLSMDLVDLSIKDI